MNFKLTEWLSMKSEEIRREREKVGLKTFLRFNKLIDPTLHK